tara:strand:- start:267 stop:428 length:162 start_codon:yes stop_codon:yes gene_type:complete
VARDKVDAIEVQTITTTQVYESKLDVKMKSPTFSDKRNKLAEQKIRRRQKNKT